MTIMIIIIIRYHLTTSHRQTNSNHELIHTVMIPTQ